MFLGVDVGSVSTNLVAMDEGGHVASKVYIRTNGQPIQALRLGMEELLRDMGGFQVDAVCTTGSGRRLAAVILGADVVKNEITAHSVGALHEVPGVRTILEIGGQDSKLIIIRQGIVSDFAMNTVCAAGTGSFLDQQAARLTLHVSEFGDMALRSTSPVRIAGRCAVFAESDMIHKQQTGHRLEDIVAGLCEALVRNYLTNLGKGKLLEAPIVFQGGVAANLGMKVAFEKALSQPVIIPEHYGVMGAVGSALIAASWFKGEGGRAGTSFRGFTAMEEEYSAGSFECRGCPNRCEVVDVAGTKGSLAKWGDRCGKWQSSETA